MEQTGFKTGDFMSAEQLLILVLFLLGLWILSSWLKNKSRQGGGTC